MLQTVSEGYQLFPFVTNCYNQYPFVTNCAQQANGAAKTAKKMEWNIKGWQTRGLIRCTFASVHNHLCGSHFCEE